MSYIKISNTTGYGSKCIRFDTIYTRCDIVASKINKLQHILGLYDTIEALVLIIDEPFQNWKITRSFDTIKHIYLDAYVKFCNRQKVLQEDFWLMFPNLETIIIYNVFIPIANLDTLQNMNTFRLTQGPSKIKKEDTKIQEIIQILTNMNTLTDIQIISSQECHISNELFTNNMLLKYVDFARNVVINNIPSIVNCLELLRMNIKINLLDNPYILELSNLEQFNITDYSTDMPIPDEIFTKPIFTTCSSQGSNLGISDARLNIHGKNLNNHIITMQQKPNISSREIANENFTVSEFWFE